MKLISKFGEYYDCGLSLGIDPNIIFNRKSYLIKEVEMVPNHSLYLSFLQKLLKKIDCQIELCVSEGWMQSNTHSYYASLLYFCGETFLYFTKYTEFNYKSRKLMTPTEVIKEIESFSPKKKKYGLGNLSKIDTIERLVRGFNNKSIPCNSTGAAYFSIEYNFECRHTREKKYLVTAYPRLLEIPGWVESRDALKDFQTLSQELARIQIPDSPPTNPKETDAQKIHRHGFDEKMGFRKGKK